RGRWCGSSSRPVILIFSERMHLSSKSFQNMSRLYLIILFVSFAVVARAQAPTASVGGKVTDQTGALIPGATVTATGADGTQVSATSDQGGGFSLNSLPAGSYTVSATAKGFAQYSQPG